MEPMLSMGPKYTPANTAATRFPGPRRSNEHFKLAHLILWLKAPTTA
jgi:hypothetical protein